jgi:competence/damage-inducible protein CinA-like protein
MSGAGDNSVQPASHASAAIISVGDELSLGQLLNTNSRWLAQRLTDSGIITVAHVTVPDDLQALTRAIARLSAEADLVLVSGGLGPTADDLTRPALAQAMNDQLVIDPLALAQVEGWFAAANRAMPDINKVQAQRPSRAATLPNLHGTAPGIHAQVGRADLFSLPGPPREMMPMFEAQVLPRLRPPKDRTVRTRVLHTIGIGESELATRLGKLMDRPGASNSTSGVLVGTTASGGIVSVRVRYEGPLPPIEADAQVEKTLREVRTAAGPYIFGADSDTLAGVVLKLLRDRGEHVGVVESCTGGQLASLITEVPGSSASFVGGLITYSNTLKQSLAGVDPALLGPAPEAPGAVSREVAVAMAVGGLGRLQVDHCLAITGIAGPGGAVPAQADRPAKPVGTVFIARCSRLFAQGKKTTDARQFLFAGDRQSIQAWSARMALAMLRLHLAGAEDVKLLRQVG